MPGNLPGNLPGTPIVLPAHTPMPPTTSNSEDDVEWLCHEEGADLAAFLMSKAIPIQAISAETKPICEWTYRDILKLPTAAQEEWKAACQCKLDILCKHKVYELVDPSKGCKIIDNQWVFDVKPNDCKCACLVAKGFSQVKDVDFDTIFSPVVRFETVWLMLALATLENWHIKSLSVHSTHLYGKLTKEIYIKQSEGFRVPGQEHKVLHLLHALYGLKQAGLTWWETLNEFMKELRFEHLKSNAGIFLYWKKGTNIVVAVIYVDDTLFCGSIKAIVDEIKGLFIKKWECKDLGPAISFINMQIKCKGHKILIDQCPYLEKVLEHFGMQNSRTAPTPLPQCYYPSKHLGSVDPELQSHFQQVIGSLLYIMLGTCPDVAYAVAALS